MASVKPVGPAPTIRTCVSMRNLVTPQSATGSKSASSVPSCTKSPTAHFSAFRRPLARRAQRVLHLHRLEHDERRAAQQIGPRLGQDARHRARHRRDDAAGCSDVGGLSRKRVDPLQLEMAARRGHIEIAARPCDGCPLRRVAQAQVEKTAVARHELQAGIGAGEFHAQPVAAVPQHGVVSLGAVPQAQATTAAAGERPTVRPVPGRAVLRRDLFMLVLLADQDRDASSGQIERRDRGLGPGQGGDFPFDKAGIDLAACHHADGSAAP